VRYPSLTSSLLILAAVTTAPSLRAQWVSFQDQTSTRLVAAAALVENDLQEKDYAWGDLDKDGDIDLVIARKQPFTSGGHFANVLLMNEGGVLTDRSSTLTTAIVAGSTAFLDATNDRDVVIADVNGDTWDDVITCTTLTAGQPQYIRVPRVYINMGNSGGVWQGLLYDDALRIDDSGWGGQQRFCSVAAGDVDGDGDIDLYFGDYQQGGARPVDIDDRLMINDGTGYFTDESAARMSTTMLESSFGMKVAIVDMNMDGKLEILKDDALNAPQGISISHNDTGTNGVFGTYQIPYNNAPYHFNIGDLNNDGLPDIIVSDDGQDRYILNETTSVGQVPVPFSPTIAFSYSGGGSDDGFGGNNLVADLDNDGWLDAIIADVDVDIGGCNRRCHIFRNLGNAPNVTLQEQTIAGQIVGGITPAAVQGTYDVAVFDINGDGWKDMVVGRCSGTEIYINDPPTGMTFSYVGGLPTMIPPSTSADVVFDASGIGGLTAVSGSGLLTYSVNGAAFQSIAMTDNGTQFSAALPGMACADAVRFYVSLQASNGQTFNDPPAAPAGFYEALAANAVNTVYQNDFEINAAGWSVVDGAGLISGTWERADPNGTVNAGQIAAPFTDAQSGTADNCFITKQGAIAEAAGLNDVDGGPTDLISPALNYDGSDGTITFQAWLYSSFTGAETLRVDVTGDGTNWTNAMTIVAEIAGAPNNTNQWRQYSFRVGDYITPTATVQVRFRAQDVGSPTIVEAGIDLFRAEKFDCTVCQPTFPTATVGAATLEMCGGDLSPGTSTTLAVAGMPALTTGLLVFDVFPVPTPWNGGELISPSPVILGNIFANASGDFIVPLSIGGLLPPGFSLYVQALYSDSSQAQQVGITNSLHVTWN
jgi:hypothetical protein